jgi:hypothetical protein
MRIFIATLALSVITASTASAGSVSGYVTRNGTYVAPHYRSSPNSTVTDNYSYKGNSNPYTGQSGSSRYGHDTSSPYFDGTPNSNGRYGHSGNRW